MCVARIREAFLRQRSCWPARSIGEYVAEPFAGGGAFGDWFAARFGRRGEGDFGRDVDRFGFPMNGGVAGRQLFDGVR